MVFHDGGVSGQSAYLRILPEDDAVLVVVSTGGVPQTFHRHAFRAMAAAAVGRTAPLGAVADPNVVIDVDRYVGTYAASATEVVIDHETGLLVPAGDAPALAAAVVKLLADGGLRDECARRARAHVLEKHSPAARFAALDGFLFG